MCNDSSMSNNLLSLESVTLLSITLIPIIILITFSICILCYYMTSSPDEEPTYFNPMPHWNQRRNLQSRAARYTHGVPNRTDSDQFLACLQNHQENINI